MSASAKRRVEVKGEKRRVNARVQGERRRRQVKEAKWKETKASKRSKVEVKTERRKVQLK